MTRQCDPIFVEAVKRLRLLFEEARARRLMEPSAASLATADLRGQPSIRTVTVVDIDQTGPIFFVDRRSGKGKQLDENPCAAMCFFWPELHQQVVVEGYAETAGAAVSDRYWAHRPREVQLAAWIGEEDTPDGDAAAGDPLASIRQRFAEQVVPRPPDWQALHLCPKVLLFWKPGWRHLHDRERYARDRGGHWQLERLPAI